MDFVWYQECRCYFWNIWLKHTKYLVIIKINIETDNSNWNSFKAIFIHIVTNTSNALQNTTGNKIWKLIQNLVTEKKLWLFTMAIRSRLWTDHYFTIFLLIIECESVWTIQSNHVWLQSNKRIKIISLLHFMIIVSIPLSLSHSSTTAIGSI